MPAILVIKNNVHPSRDNEDPTSSEEHLWPGDAMDVLDPAETPDPGSAIGPPNHLVFLVPDATKEELEYLKVGENLQVGPTISLPFRKRLWSLRIDQLPAGLLSQALDSSRRNSRNYPTLARAALLNARVNRNSDMLPHLKVVRNSRGGRIGRLVQ